MTVAEEKGGAGADTLIGGAGIDTINYNGPAAVTVTDIALQWGFGHLGKFSVAYKQRFGESPSTIFRRWR